MKERPILFSAPMVRALLDGSKTQTRRIVKRPKFVPINYILNPSMLIDKFTMWWQGEHGGVGWSQECPYGKPGERLWVRETFCDIEPRYGSSDPPVLFRADLAAGEQYLAVDKWKPSIFMLRKLSRIDLEIVSVRVERLQDISRGDAMAEGCPFANMRESDPVGWYRELWES